MINNLNMEYLKIFYFVAKEGNITRVAEKMFVSQSAVTQTIQKLENKIGFSLFVREKKKIILTSVGQELYEKLKPVFSYLDFVDYYLNNINSIKDGEIKIACGSNIAKKVLVKPISNFVKQFPDIKIKILDGVNDELKKMLNEGKIDIFISQNDENMAKNFNNMHIFTEKYIFACSKNYYENFYKNGERKFILLGKGSKSREVFEKYCIVNNLNYECNLEVSGFNILLELCKLNEGIIMVPNYIFEKEKSDLVKIDMFNTPNIDYFCFTNKFTKSQIVNKFLEYMK